MINSQLRSKFTKAIVIGAITVCTLGILPANGQQPNPRRQGLVHQNDRNPENEPSLDANYRISIEGHSVDLEGKPITGIADFTLALLTSSPKITLAGSTDKSETPGIFQLTAYLSKLENGRLNLSYTLNVTKPHVESSVIEGANKKLTSVSYRDHRNQGSLIVEIGKTYDLYRAADKLYKLTITKE